MIINTFKNMLVNLINFKFLQNKFRMFFIVCLFLNTTLFAQKATVEITPRSFLIGDQATITLQLKLNAPQQVLWPVFADSTATYKLDVIKRGEVDTLKSDSSKFFTLSQKIVFTSFDSGTVVIPPFSFYAMDSTFIAITDSLRLNVNTVAVDTSKAFRDIHDTLGEYLRFNELLPWILLSVAILLVLGFGLFFYYRKKKNKPLFTLFQAKSMTANEFAVSELSRLREKRLWQQGQVKEYYSELTNVLRLYISQRFNIDALEMLSSEIVEQLSDHEETVDNVSSLDELLTLADMVKFAKELPLPNDNDRFIGVAMDFVTSNLPKEKEEIGKKSV